MWFQEYLKPIFYGNDEEAKTISRDVLYPYELVHPVVLSLTCVR